MTRFGRRRESLAELAREAADAALDEAGRPDVDHCFFGLQSPSELAGDANAASMLASALGLVPAAATRVESAPSSGASALEAAWFAVRSGDVRTALVVGAESMTRVPTPVVSRVLAKTMDARERALGLTMPAYGALAARRYLWRYGYSREDLAAVPVKAHAHGARHPRAHFAKEVSVEDVLASPMIADPLRTFDCAPVSDGAAAVVLTADRGDVRVTSVGHATDAYAFSDRTYTDALTSFRATRVAAERAFARSTLTRADVDVLEVHDAFSVLEPMSLEDLGFFGTGTALRATLAGDTSLGGPLPVNAGGGLKARGHPVGATGVAQVVELVEQLTGRAGGRQVDGARVGLAQSVGGFGTNIVVTLLEVAA